MSNRATPHASVFTQNLCQATHSLCAKEDMHCRSDEDARTVHLEHDLLTQFQIVPTHTTPAAQAERSAEPQRNTRPASRLAKSGLKTHSQNGFSNRHTCTAREHPIAAPAHRPSRILSMHPTGVAAAQPRRLLVEHKIGDVALPRAAVAEEDLPHVLEVGRAAGREGAGVRVLGARVGVV